ncbi:MAG: hypothetical protein CVV46_08260 [Spirochaetae bacterium HGW-Spirochaetae-2]|nr:MAG: hypothetical protein CVV46_08260 [Spirochaetae bacterium HGW-Spirochaetae-2]
MSKFFRWFFGTLFALLLGLLGIERKKNQKKDEVIKEQKEQIERQKKQSEISKFAHEMTFEASTEMEKIESEQKIEEHQIIETSDEMGKTIEIANDIVSRFNAD